jgi:hypothetical protein
MTQSLRLSNSGCGVKVALSANVIALVFTLLPTASPNSSLECRLQALDSTGRGNELVESKADAGRPDFQTAVIKIN